MQNFRATIAYDGTGYHGWQVQSNARTIQGELTRVLSTLDHGEVVIHGAGRTDAGVHAEGQVASFELTRVRDLDELRDAINGNLDRDLRVLDVEEAEADFHARRSARDKVYRYRIWNSDVVSPFIFRFVHHHRGELDVDAMRRAAQCLSGRHDFSAFSTPDESIRSRVRTLRSLTVSRAGEEIVVEAAADGFLRYMVRAIAGTLLEVGRGQTQADAVEVILSSGKRELAGPTAPACGLTLIKVGY